MIVYVTLCGGIRPPCCIYATLFRAALYATQPLCAVMSHADFRFPLQLISLAITLLCLHVVLSRWTLAGVLRHSPSPRQGKTRMVAGSFEGFVVGSCHRGVASPLYLTKRRGACVQEQECPHFV